MAQRMESAAPPGGVDAQRVHGAARRAHVAVLGEPRSVHVKGADAPVPARRLLGMDPTDGGRPPSTRPDAWAATGN